MRAGGRGSGGKGKEDEVGLLDLQSFKCVRMCNEGESG